MPINLNKHYNLGELTYEQVDSNWDNVQSAVNNNEALIQTRTNQNNFNATGNPGSGNNQSQGYTPGSLWYNQNSNVMWICTASSSSSATWVTTDVVAGMLGSAAFADVTTSPTDTTAGRITKVGDGGWLGTAISPPGLDLDNASGFTALYASSSSVANRPPLLSNTGVMLNLERGSGGQGCQLYVSQNGGIASRGTGDGVVFSDWVTAPELENNNTFTANQTINANLNVTGSVSKGSGSFKITHPLPEMSETHHLVHSFIEGPQADLMYRGSVQMTAGTATVDIDTAAGMTSGTFELLCRDVQVWVQNEDGWDKVRGSVTGSTLTIESENTSSTDTVSWLVIGERQDPHMIAADWTDEEGHVIVEPLIPEPEPQEPKE